MPWGRFGAGGGTVLLTCQRDGPFLAFPQWAKTPCLLVHYSGIGTWAWLLAGVCRAVLQRWGTTRHGAARSGGLAGSASWAVRGSAGDYSEHRSTIAEQTQLCPLQNPSIHRQLSHPA